MAKLLYHYIQFIVSNAHSSIDRLNKQSVQEHHQVETTLLGVLQVAHLLRVVAISLLKSSKKFLDFFCFGKICGLITKAGLLYRLL